MRTVVLLLLLLAAPLHAAETIDPGAAFDAARRGELTIVDIRRPSEWSSTGLPAGALAISLEHPGTGGLRPGFVADVAVALGGDRHAPVALICARGIRSKVARSLLERAGFTSVVDITEGIAGSGAGPGWLERGLPVEPCATC